MSMPGWTGSGHLVVAGSPPSETRSPPAATAKLDDRPGTCGGVAETVLNTRGQGDTWASPDSFRHGLFEQRASPHQSSMDCPRAQLPRELEIRLRKFESCPRRPIEFPSAGPFLGRPSWTGLSSCFPREARATPPAHPLNARDVDSATGLLHSLESMMVRHPGNAHRLSARSGVSLSSHCW
jgi:hypothetical protein